MQLSQEVAPGVAWLRTVMVNVVFVEPEPHDGRWVLVDAGLAGHHRVIARAARARFGDRPPAAIVLTHAHFDHVGSLERLLEVWDVPVYAHALELPHLTGRRSYPPPDPTVGGGLMAWCARLYPCGPIDISTRVRALPDDGCDSAAAGMAVVAHPRTYRWTRVAVPGHRSGAGLGRCGDHGAAGIARRGDHAGTSAARPACVLHDRLGRSTGLGT